MRQYGWAHGADVDRTEEDAASTAARRTSRDDDVDRLVAFIARNDVGSRNQPACRRD